MDLCACQHVSFLLLRVKGEIACGLCAKAHWAWLLGILANSFHPGLSNREGNRCCTALNQVGWHALL